MDILPPVSQRWTQKGGETVSDDAQRARVATLEAFADTVIPGEKRWPGDRAVAGVSDGGGAVAAGALALLELPEVGLAAGLAGLAALLDERAAWYATEHGLAHDPSVPPFVALPYDDRVELVRRVTAPGHPAKDLWVGLAVFCTMAFDAAAHLHTTDAIAADHPGLATIGFRPPEADGVWRFPRYSYQRPLADQHPDTTPSGSPA
ncbi:MAG TPA: DUF5987 family protein [Micromonosporaceae bacterium]